jgi:hypothetical protein
MLSKETVKMRNMLILCGRAYSGKSTAARYITENREGWKEIRLSRYIKDLCSEQYGLDRERLDGDNDSDREWRENTKVYQDYTPRDLLIKIGTELRENDHTILPKVSIEDINQYPDYNIVVSDCRFQEDIDYLVEHSGMKTFIVKLHRNDIPYRISQEDSIDMIVPDYTLVNSSLDEMYRKLDELLEKVIFPH